MNIVEQPTLTEGKVLALYQAVGWTAYTDAPEKLLPAIEASTWVAVIRKDDALVGLVRVLSDGAHIAYLQDILVHPDWHRKGIGKRLIEGAMTRFGHVRSMVLMTDDRPQQRGFYEAMGWRHQSAYPSLNMFVRFAG